MNKYDVIRELDKKKLLFCSVHRLAVDSYRQGINDALNLIEQLDDSAPTGKWIEEEPLGNDYWKCSCCGCVDQTKYPTKFCPRCGAKMENHRCV